MASSYDWTCALYVERGTYDAVVGALDDALTHQEGPDFEDFSYVRAEDTKDGYDVVYLSAIFQGGASRAEEAEKWLIEQVTQHAKKPAHIDWTDGGGAHGTVWAWNGSREELVEAIGKHITHEVSESINCLVNDQLSAGATVDQCADIVEALYTQVGSALLATRSSQVRPENTLNVDEGDE